MSPPSRRRIGRSRPPKNAGWIEEEPETFTTAWTFDGTLQFIRHEETLAAQRADLILLFESLQAADRDAIVAGLRQLEGRLAAG